MSDTTRKHLKPKAYRSRRPKHKTGEAADALKTPKQRRAAERRDWKRGLTA